MKKILGSSPQITHLLRTLPMIAASDVSVLIYGETGTGKELLAQALHSESSRKDKPLITINCAALQADGVELDLFGRCDAEGKVIHQGRFLAADGGTVFLDEVNALPLSIQAKVLRFLEAGECQLQGSHKLHVSNVRILAATGTNLQEEVGSGRFRADHYENEVKISPYYYAISGVNLQVRMQSYVIQKKLSIACSLMRGPVMCES